MTNNSSINAFYLQEKTKKQISQQLKKEKVVQLEKFFTKEMYAQLRKLARTSKYIQAIKPLGSTYHVAKTKNTLFLLRDLSAFLQQIVKKKIRTIDVDLLYLTWKDYSILHDDMLNKAEFIIDLTEGWDQDAGGNVMYTDGYGNFITLVPGGNTLTIANSSSLKRFFQYVNHYGKNKKRYLLVCTINS
jgi:hypothetical protein